MLHGVRLHMAVDAIRAFGADVIAPIAIAMPDHTTARTAKAPPAQDGKTYRSRGSVKQINGQETTLDTMVIFAGQYIVPAAETFDVDEEIKKARGIYKKQQRDFRLQRNTEKVAKLEAEMPERVAKMRAQREAQQAKEAEAAPAEAPQNGRRR